MVAGRVTEVVAHRRYLLYKFGPSTVNVVTNRKWSQMRGVANGRDYCSSKGDGNVRICGDYKVTINPYIDLDQYPMPNPDDLFSTLAGGKKFSRLDLKQAYQQMLVDPRSQQYLTINTHKGMFTYTRMPFGISSAPSI